MAIAIAPPKIMGILNVTPDSFSDGGRYFECQKAIDHAHQMIDDGADIIDIGGESTRPGAQPISEQEEMDRVLPVIEALSKSTKTLLSIDTSHPAVMAAALKAGAGFVNDVRALQMPGAMAVVAQADVPVCLMHMQGQPNTMQAAPQYDHVLETVYAFLKQRAEDCLAAGIKASHIIIDPGFGFGKRLEDNCQLLSHLDHFQALGYPILVGLSRKSMFGQLLKAPEDKRLIGSISGGMIALMKGAQIIRVHDVPETRDMVRVFHQVFGC